LTDEVTAARLRAERDGLTEIAWPEWLNTAKDQDRVGELKASQAKLFEARLQSYASQASVLRQKIAQSNEEITGLQGAIASQKQELALLHEQIVDYTGLLQKGLVDKPRVLEVRRRQAEIEGDRLKNEAAIARAQQEIAESEIRIKELDTDRVNAAADD